MFGARAKTQMVRPEDALPGRDDYAFPIPAEHHVNGRGLTPPWPEGHEVVAFGMGCFWGAERIFWQLPGVFTTAAVYAGGHSPHPTYREVCTGQTGHTEAVVVVYDPAVIDLDGLLGRFWENHDPTQGMRQGNDVGTQYRSGIYTTSDEQRQVAEASRGRYQAKLSENGYDEIATEIAPLGEWYFAEPEHQQYLDKNPGGYCNHGFCQVAYA